VSSPNLFSLPRKSSQSRLPEHKVKTSSKALSASNTDDEEMSLESALALPPDIIKSEKKKAKEKKISGTQDQPKEKDSSS